MSSRLNASHLNITVLLVYCGWFIWGGGGEEYLVITCKQGVNKKTRTGFSWAVAISHGWSFVKIAYSFRFFIFKMISSCQYLPFVWFSKVFMFVVVGIRLVRGNKRCLLMFLPVSLSLSFLFCFLVTTTCKHWISYNTETYKSTATPPPPPPFFFLLFLLSWFTTDWLVCTNKTQQSKLCVLW